MYSFHASASAYMEFWNNSFGKTQQDVVYKMSRRQIWQAFVQESIRTIAASADMKISLRDNLAINEITKEAFSILGENGVIRAADQHACSECTHEYIGTTSDNTLAAGSDAVAGVDEDVEQLYTLIQHLHLLGQLLTNPIEVEAERQRSRSSEDLSRF